MNDSSSFCIMSSSIWQFIGYLLFALKILVPLIIIILGVVDFVKAVTSSKDEAITSAAKNLGLRIMIGLIIFFVPLIISTVFKFVKEANSYVAAADACQRCLLRPFTSECEGYKAVAKEERENQKGKLDEAGGQKVEAVHCYFVYNDGDTDGKYVWGIEKTKGYDHVTLESKYYSAASCTSSLNSTKVLNYTTKPNEDDNDYSSNPQKIGNKLTKEEVEAKLQGMTTAPTYNDLLKIAKNGYGMSEDIFKIVFGWAVNEGYDGAINNKGVVDHYLGYLCDCVGINLYKGYDLKTPAELAQKLAGGDHSGTYDPENLTEQANRAINNPGSYEPQFKGMYLALKYPDENAHDCYGSTSSEDAYYTSKGGNLHYQGEGYYGGPAIKVWTLWYSGIKNWKN